MEPSGSRRRRKGARLEITSLMDVMFLVLVFFIYCMFDMAVHHGVKVDLPQAPGALEKGERIVVTILADDSMQLNGSPCSCDEAVAKISALVAAGAPADVIVAGDRNASLGAGVSLIARLKASGVERVSFQMRGATE